MEITMPSPRKRRRWEHCPVCGRAALDASRGDCAGCTGLFDLHPGGGLYSPSTGKLWFKSQGNGRLVNPQHVGNLSARVDLDGLSRPASRGSRWGLLFLAAAICTRKFSHKADACELLLPIITCKQSVSNLDTLEVLGSPSNWGLLVSNPVVIIGPTLVK